MIRVSVSVKEGSSKGLQKGKRTLQLQVLPLIPQPSRVILIFSTLLGQIQSQSLSDAETLILLLYVAYSEFNLFLWQLYDKAEICKTLKVNRHQLLALAIISGNDYRKNVLGFGIGRNLKVLKSLNESNDVALIVQKYEEEIELEKGYIVY